ncbi:MAG: RNA polymerase sigma factor [Bryobacteraceae bacterium]
MLTSYPNKTDDTDEMSEDSPGLSSEASERSPAGNPVSEVNWSELVGKIQAGDQAGMEELYRLFTRGIRFYLCRQLGQQELEDKVHDTFVIVVQAIRRGDLREPERLMGFVRTVVRRQVAAHIDQAVQNRRDQADIDTGIAVADVKANPEDTVIGREKAEIMVKVLRSLSSRDREILTRFYLHEQSQEQICSAMNLTDTQFRLLKSRAKARFGDLGKKRISRKPVASFLMRTLASLLH